ncbi:polysaccharide export protein [Rhizobium sp. KVB221]|uniref:Polysaccharide export protein n=1 Tax=Rhizobium setariae TaxID=2801340 RepID=A0A936YL73_9HYPH|nr:polysaccharide export protein [Rhizobium setariae]
MGVATAVSLSVTAGCNAVPNDGPLASEVQKSSAGGKTYEIPEGRIKFDVVQVDQRVANSATQLGQPSLVKTFGVGGAPSTPVIGVGDELQVTIFEAGPDGLFSTTNSKATNIPVMVQPDGHGQIPYAGSVRFAGKTLEGARQEIVGALKAKAVEPDVIVTMTKNLSRTVSVQGAVNNPQMVQIGLAGAPLTSVVALAGGAAKPPFDTYVTLTRGRKSSTVLLQSVIDNPKDDVYINPLDKIFLTYDPQTFTALGSTLKAGKIPFEAGSLSLIEAAALAGGSRADLADPRGYFVFRYEYEPVYRQVVGESRFRDLLSKGMMANKDGRYPIVYRIDLTDPQSYIVTQSFPIRNKDVLYLSRHPSTDFVKFMALVSSPVRIARDVDAIMR